MAEVTIPGFVPDQQAAPQSGPQPAKPGGGGPSGMAAVGDKLREMQRANETGAMLGMGAEGTLAKIVGALLKGGGARAVAPAIKALGPGVGTARPVGGGATRVSGATVSPFDPNAPITAKGGTHDYDIQAALRGSPQTALPRPGGQTPIAGSGSAPAPNTIDAVANAGIRSPIQPPTPKQHMQQGPATPPWPMLKALNPGRAPVATGEPIAAPGGQVPGPKQPYSMIDLLRYMQQPEATTALGSAQLRRALREAIGRQL